MADFDMHTDTPAAPTAMAAGDRFAYDDVSANAAAGGFETIEAEDLLDALLRVADQTQVLSVDPDKLIVHKRTAAADNDEFRIDPSTGEISYFSSNFVDMKLVSPASAEIYMTAGGVRRLRFNSTYLMLGSGHMFAFAADADPLGSTPDTASVRAAAGVWRDTDGSTGIGKRLCAKLVEANTAGSGAPNVLTATESRTVLTNEGAASQNYHTLPTAAAGLEFEFVVQDTDGIRVAAAAGDTIRDGATVSALAGFIQSTTQGSTLRVLAINATEWVVLSKTGTWTVDS